jgi:biotin-dependent carboxylase-like uncharacterized protein
MTTIEVLRAGLCDLVMDQGRYGFVHLGVPVGGAADARALVRVNRLVGNADDAAGLEITLRGPVLAFPHGGTIALTGAPFEACRSGGDALVWNEAMTMAPGAQLSLGAVTGGCRCWLAVQGGVRVPQVMASSSTFLPQRFGGLDGRALRAGDVLDVGAQPPRDDQPHVLPVLEFSADIPLHVIPGPQAAIFSDAGLAAFFSTPYRVTAASDRRGLRLHGVPVTPSGKADTASQAVLPGAIQVPPDGQPIILGWDGPVTGGYPLIAGLISADLPRLAQLRPGDSVRFATVTVESARALARTEETDDGY